MSTSTIAFVSRLEPEDGTRADLYALFARLFFSAPDAQLLHLINAAPPLAAEADSARLARAWARLCAAAGAMDVDAAEEEYDALFGGVAQSLISLYGSYYAAALAPGLAGQFLVDLRAALAGLGLGLRRGRNLPEDHLAAVLETMRLLIAGDAENAPRDVAAQREFFSRFIAPWHAQCCSAIAAAPIANFYRTVAECTDAFLAIEDESLAIA